MRTSDLVVKEHRVLYLENYENVNLIVESGASCVVLTYNNAETKSLNIKANIKEKGSLVIYQIMLLEQNFSLEEEITLESNETSVQLLGVYLSDKEMISNINVYHQAPQTTSSLETYAIGKNTCQMILNNNTYILPGMTKSKARQKARGLTLAKEARITANPNLYISECDVEASHAAAIGSISEEELFYLMSRGLTFSEALNMYVLGFINPLIDNIDAFADMKAKLKETFSQKLK